MSSPLGETLRRARLSKNVTFEDAERVTRIRREYLEALEREDFTKLPAPVYARGFLRSYAGYLGLDPGELMPFFPVGHVEEPRLDPLPEVEQPRTWNMNGVLAIGVVGLLILLVVALYSVGFERARGGGAGLRLAGPRWPECRRCSLYSPGDRRFGLDHLREAGRCPSRADREPPARAGRDGRTRRRRHAHRQPVSLA